MEIQVREVLFFQFSTFWTEPPFKANVLLGDPPSRGLLYFRIRAVEAARVRDVGLDQLQRFFINRKIHYRICLASDQLLRLKIVARLLGEPSRGTLEYDKARRGINNKLVRLCDPQHKI